MSNFNFLQSEFNALYPNAKRVESLALSDPRGSCFYARLTLELAVNWLYDHDRTLRRPYQQMLGALIHEPTLQQLLPPPLFNKAKAIQKAGNQAAHSSKPIRQYDAMRICKELFHFLYWLARTYTRESDPKDIEANFNPDILQQAQVKVSPSTVDVLKKQEASIQSERKDYIQRLKKRETTISFQSRTLEEREAKLKELDAELAQLRSDLADAKAINLKVPDDHDYSELETRKLIIDLLLREAGWTIGTDVSEEYPVTGMPNKKGEGFVDYVLWADDGMPLAVVEAKKALKDPHVGQQQAKLYADCLETMKEQRPVIFYTNGYETWLWDDTFYPARMVQGFYTKDELLLMIQRRYLRLDLHGKPVKNAIVDRPYQKRAIKSMTESFMQAQRKGLLAMATGTGKTRTVVGLVELLMRCNWVKRTLFLADRVALVNQAVAAFKTHLPESSPVNLVTEKDGQGRVYVCTYPTMVGLIDTMDGDQRSFGVGYFDLVIIDEAHRSVYQKYGAIFDYFDSLLVGLTATPRDEVHHDTYNLFDLEIGIPTDAYSLDKAVEDGYLVPPKSVSVPLKFQREGIKYDDLGEDEKEHWEELDWGEYGPDGPPDSVDANAVSKWLFNTDTVDKVLKHLMEHGQKVDGGDTLGKTIIFAKNHDHALFIEKRFNIHYPFLKGHFARVIDHFATYAQSLIDDFSTTDKPLQIAISVDMLDTGIDVPDVVNLVFFKIVRSKTKFLQMVGRGTRLRPDLFGPGEDKAFFSIFDYCGNLEFFNTKPEGVEGKSAEPISTRIFKHRLHLLEAIQHMLGAPEPVRQVAEGVAPYGGDNQLLDNPIGKLYVDTIDILHREVAAMNVDNFIVRPRRKQVERFKIRATWDTLNTEKLSELFHQLAGLPAELEKEDITAKLFDLTCLQLQLSLIENSSAFVRLKKRVQDIAADLEEKEAIPMVKAQMVLIQEVQTDEYWQDVTLPMLETLRRKLRDLVKFIDNKTRQPVYTILQDEIGEGQAVDIGSFSAGINLAQYRKKVAQFIRANEDHITISKLKYNKPLTASDLSELERFLFESGEVQSREQFEKAFGKHDSLSAFIRSLVGLDRNAAKQAFSKYLDETQFNTSQIRFIEKIIDHLTQRGIMDAGLLYEEPFTGIHYEGLDGVFPSATADEIVTIIELINANAEVSEAA